MNRLDRPVGEDDLTAHVDGRLPADREAVVAAFLREQPKLEADLALDRVLKVALRDRLEPRAREPIPTRLRVSVLRGERLRRRRRFASLLAAACLCLAVGGATGWYVRDFTGGPRPTAGRAWAGLARDALSAYRAYTVEIVHPVEVKADEEAHLQQWLSKRLRRSLVIPDLSDEFGLNLIGGRLLPAGPDVAALLMYADAAGNRLTLYVRTGETGETSLNFVRESDVSTFSWIEQGTGFAVSASMDREKLQKVAKAVLQEFDMDATRRRRAL